MILRSGEVFFSEQSESFIIPESVSLFGFTISFYGVLLVVAALVGIIAVTEITRRRQQGTEFCLTLVTLTIVAALLGGRIYYVMFEWQKFVQEPLMLLNFRSGGLSYFGALFGAWFAVKGYCRKKNADFVQHADVLSFGAAAAAPFVWCGCAFVREPLGKTYDGLFSVRIGGEYASQTAGGAFVSVHPVAVYGVACGVLVFVALLAVLRKTKQSGAVFSAYLVLHAAEMLGLEFFRAESYKIWGTGIPVNIVVGGVILLTVIVGWVRQFSLNKKLSKIRFNGN